MLGAYTYTETETSNKGERAPPPDGEHRNVKRAVLGSDLYTYICDVSTVIRKVVCQTNLQKWGMAHFASCILNHCSGTKRGDFM